MKRTLIDLLWSETDFEIKYIIVIEITTCYDNVPFV